MRRKRRLGKSNRAETAVENQILDCSTLSCLLLSNSWQLVFSMTLYEGAAAAVATAAAAAQTPGSQTSHEVVPVGKRGHRGNS